MRYLVRQSRNSHCVRPPRLRMGLGYYCWVLFCPSKSGSLTTRRELGVRCSWSRDYGTRTRLATPNSTKRSRAAVSRTSSSTAPQSLQTAASTSTLCILPGQKRPPSLAQNPPTASGIVPLADCPWGSRNGSSTTNERPPQRRQTPAPRRSRRKPSRPSRTLGLRGVQLVIEKLDLVLLHQGKTQLLRLAFAHRPHDIAGDLSAHLGVFPGAVARRLDLL